MNADLGRKVLDHVTAHREQFDMSEWGYQDECETSACLAGHAMLQSGYKLSQTCFIRPDGEPVTSAHSEGRGLLALTDAEFYGTDPEGCGLFFDDADSAIERLRALVEAAEAAVAS